MFDTFDRFIAILVIRYFRCGATGRRPPFARVPINGVGSRMQIGTFNWKVNPTMGHDYSRLPGGSRSSRYSFVRSQLFQIPHCPGIRINWVLRSRYLRKHFRSLMASAQFRASGDQSCVVADAYSKRNYPLRATPGANYANFPYVHAYMSQSKNRRKNSINIITRTQKQHIK